MMVLHQTSSDDPEFLRLVGNIVDGIAQVQGGLELYAIHIDNWFDHKWLRFSGKILGALGVHKEDGLQLTMPPFHPHRVLAQQCFIRSESEGEFREVELPRELHRYQWSSDNLQRRIQSAWHPGVWIWFSGNTLSNKMGSVMVYDGTDSGWKTWYVCLESKEYWKPTKMKEISRAEVDSLLAGAP